MYVTIGMRCEMPTLKCRRAGIEVRSERTITRAAWSVAHGTVLRIHLLPTYERCSVIWQRVLHIGSRREIGTEVAEHHDAHDQRAETPCAV